MADTPDVADACASCAGLREALAKKEEAYQKLRSNVVKLKEKMMSTDKLVELYQQQDQKIAKLQQELEVAAPREMERQLATARGEAAQSFQQLQETLRLMEQSNEKVTKAQQEILSLKERLETMTTQYNSVKQYNQQMELRIKLLSDVEKATKELPRVQKELAHSNAQLTTVTREKEELGNTLHKVRQEAMEIKQEKSRLERELEALKIVRATQKAQANESLDGGRRSSRRAAPAATSGPSRSKDSTASTPSPARSARAPKPSKARSAAAAAEDELENDDDDEAPVAARRGAKRRIVSDDEAEEARAPSHRRESDSEVEDDEADESRGDLEDSPERPAKRARRADVVRALAEMTASRGADELELDGDEGEDSQGPPIELVNFVRKPPQEALKDIVCECQSKDRAQKAILRLMRNPSDSLSQHLALSLLNYGRENDFHYNERVDDDFIRGCAHLAVVASEKYGKHFNETFFRLLASWLLSVRGSVPESVGAVVATVFTRVCRMKNDMVRARLLLFDVLRGKAVLQTGMILAMAREWPSVVAAKDEADVLASAIESICCDRQLSGTTLLEFDAIASLCRWSQACGTGKLGENLIQLVTSLRQECVELPPTAKPAAVAARAERLSTVILAIELMATWADWSIVYNEVVVGQLWGLASVFAPHQGPAVQLMGILAELGLNTNPDVDASGVRPIASLLYTVLCIPKGNVAPEVQTFAAYGLGRLCVRLRRGSSPVPEGVVAWEHMVSTCLMKLGHSERTLIPTDVARAFKL